MPDFFLLVSPPRLVAMSDDNLRARRRPFLRAATSAGLVGFSSLPAVASSSETIEVPVAKSGEEVLATRTVPRTWWNHVKRVRRIKDRVHDRARGDEAIRNVKIGLGPKRIGGRRAPEVKVEVESGASVSPDTLSDVDDVGVQAVPAVQSRLTCTNHGSWSLVPGGVTFGNPDAALEGTSGCPVVYQGTKHMLTAAHQWTCFDGDPVNNGRATQNGDDFGWAGFPMNRSLDYKLVSPEEKSVGSAIEYNGNYYDVAGHATNYEALIGEDTVYKTGKHSGYTTGNITAVGSSRTDQCIDLSGSGLEYSNIQVEGDSGAAPFILESIDGRQQAVVTGLASLGTQCGPPTWECHWDFYYDCTGTAGVSAEAIHSDNTYSILFSG